MLCSQLDGMRIDGVYGLLSEWGSLTAGPPLLMGGPATQTRQADVTGTLHTCTQADQAPGQIPLPLFRIPLFKRPCPRSSLL